MRLVILLALCAAAAACSIGGDEDLPGGSASAIRDAYLMAHGMAEGYREQARADPQVLAELSRLDAEAALAVRNMGGDGDADESQRAVAALTDFAARQSSLER